MISWKPLFAFAALSGLTFAAVHLPSASTPKRPMNETNTIAKGEKIEVLCSFFPIYLFTKNVVGDRPNVAVNLMIPSEKGCPHDYDLTPEDVKKIARANVLIINGGGIEEFGDDKVKKINSKIKIVDSSSKIKMIEGDDDHDAKDAKHDHDHKDHKHDHDDKDHKHEHKADETKKDDDHEHHHHGGKNPHFFSSPAQAALQVEAIAEKLAEIDPDGAATYKQNAADYAKRLRDLAEEFKKASAGFKNKKIVTMHEVFDYLARDIGLEVAATIEDAPGKDPSASRMRTLIKSILENKPAAVFTEPQYDPRAAAMIAKDAKIKTASLDPVASGPADVSNDYYETTMRKNLETLRKFLGE